MDDILNGFDYVKLKVSVLLAFFGIVSLTYGFRGGISIKSNSVISILVFMMLIVISYLFLMDRNRRRRRISLLGGGILSVFFYIGAEFESYHTILSPNLKLVIYFMGIFLMISFTLDILFCFIDNGNKSVSVNKMKLRRRTVFLCFWIGILLFWIPAFLAVFPGIYSYDASLQILQIFGNQGLDAHHPVLHTLILNGCMLLGKLIWNNYNYGVAVYSIIQAMSLAAVFAYACTTMLNYPIHRIFIIVSFIFFAVNPINQIWAFVTTKDLFFTVFFVLCIIFSIQIIYDRDFSNRKIGLFSFSAILMCLFRNQGIYIVVFFLPFLLMIAKKYRKKIILASLFIVLAVEGYHLVLFEILNIEKGSVREALSVPIQQMARVYQYHYEDYSKEDLELLHHFIPEENWKSYIPEISDPVKGGFQDDFFAEHKIDFIKIWFQTGMNHKMLYLESFLYGSYGYWYVDASPRWITYIWFDGYFMEPQYNILNIQRSSKFPLYETYLRSIAYHLSYEKIPGIAVILNQGFPFWIGVVSLLYLLYKRKYDGILCLILPFGLWGTILLGPCICVRYAYPLIAAEPVLFSLLFINKGSHITKEEA